MKLRPQPPSWLPTVLHLAHGMIAFGAGYLLSNAAVLYMAAAPGSTESLVYLAGAIALAMFEAGFLAWIFLRRRRLRNLWREAAALTRAEKFEQARLPLLDILAFNEYRMRPQPVLFALGACDEGLGRHRQALVFYRRCGEFEPAQRAIGMLQLERGLPEAAAEAMRKVVARHPDDVIAVVVLAIALTRGGHMEAAARVIKRALELRPKSEMLRQNLSRVESGQEPALTIDRKAK
ncbi:MAG: tetratricopeptide repeat protein [Planctomycetes bacterium]|nr:tetratricopeptide repeat protein [Planctomycetota bacterium]